MADAVEQVLEETLRLSPDQRVRLVTELLATLQPDTPGERRSEEEWIEEIERRARGQAVQGYPGLKSEPRFRAGCRVGDRRPPLVRGVDELADAAAWYGERQPGLEVEFLIEVDRGLPLIGT